VAAVFVLAATVTVARAAHEAQAPQRIVSMSPALTEILFALDLGERVVGVTRYCDYPPEAATRPRVGGYLDPSYEAIVALRPDLVLLQVEHGEVRTRLTSFGLDTMEVDLRRVAAVPDTIEAVARRCGVAEKGAAVAGEIRSRLEALAAKTRGLPRPRVLVAVERDLGTGTVTRVWAAGPGSFYHDVLELAGGENVITDSRLPYPEVSREGLVHLDPDVIVDVVAEPGLRGADLASARADWGALQELRAVRTNRVVLLDQGFMVVPGPRIASVVEAVAAALHPATGRDP